MSFLKKSKLSKLAFSNQALSLNLNLIEKIFDTIESFAKNN